MTEKQLIINTAFIRLDQLLKWSDLAASGSAAKIMIEAGKVTVNQEVEKRRGRKIYPGDSVKIADLTLRVGNGR